jgi:hypothetical protein
MASALGQHPNFKPKTTAKRKKPVQHERNKVHIPLVKFLSRALDPATQAVWHTPNEAAVPVQRRVILRSMGLLSGVPDLILLSPPHGAYALEAKYGKNKLSENQEAFKKVWTTQFPWVTFYTPEQAERELRELGVPLKATMLGVEK